MKRALCFITKGKTGNDQNTSAVNETPTPKPGRYSFRYSLRRKEKTQNGQGNKKTEKRIFNRYSIKTKKMAEKETQTEESFINSNNYKELACSTDTLDIDDIVPHVEYLNNSSPNNSNESTTNERNQSNTGEVTENSQRIDEGFCPGEMQNVADYCRPLLQVMFRGQTNINLAARVSQR